MTVALNEDVSDRAIVTQPFSASVNATPLIPSMPELYAGVAPAGVIFAQCTPRSFVMRSAFDVSTQPTVGVTSWKSISAAPEERPGGTGVAVGGGDDDGAGSVVAGLGEGVAVPAPQPQTRQQAASERMRRAVNRSSVSDLTRAVAGGYPVRTVPPGGIEPPSTG